MHKFADILHINASVVKAGKLKGFRAATYFSTLNTRSAPLICPASVRIVQ